MEEFTVILTKKEMDILTYLIASEVFRMKDYEKIVFESQLIYNLDELDNTYMKLLR